MRTFRDSHKLTWNAGLGTLENMDDLKRAVRQTMVYLDDFDFSPTLLEVQKYLLRLRDGSIPSLSTLEHVLSNDRCIERAQGFYFLHGRKNLVWLRQQKYLWSEEKRRATRWLMYLLAAMPGVRGVAYVNAMGWRNATAESDIDLFIITAHGKTWTARFWTTLVAKILRQRPGERRRSRAVCLSCYCSEDHLSLQDSQDSQCVKDDGYDIHFAYWIYQHYPIFDETENVFLDFVQKNQWIASVFTYPQWPQSMPRAQVHLPHIVSIIKHGIEKISCEHFLKNIQWRLLPRTLKRAAVESTNVVLHDDYLKLHLYDRRRQVQQHWKKRCDDLISSRSL